MSILIPALNEEKNIRKTIFSIKENVPKTIEYEIVVGDHGSTDQTKVISKGLGARVIEKDGGTISELRNDLAKSASGDVLIFNDADVLLTREWGDEIIKILDKISENNERSVIGGMLIPPPLRNWLIDYWFGLQKLEEKIYAGTGHLIISKSFFDAVGGFDNALTSGEDYDLSMRSRAAGANVYIDKNLHVVHMDYPDSLKKFFYREIWHGIGDFRDCKTFIKSKVSLVAMGFVVSIAVFVLNVLFLGKFLVWNMLLVISIPAACSMWKFKNLNIIQRLMNIFIWSLYLLARAVSFLYRKNSGRLAVIKK